MKPCKEWVGGRNGDGYGYLTLGGKRYKAHKLAYLEAHGLTRIPPGLQVHHLCDNPSCVEPDHLTLGTPKQNVEEAVERDRWPSKAGAKNGRAKLTEQDVLEIRERHARGEKRALVAERFGVSPTLISQIVSRRVWAHLTDDESLGSVHSSLANAARK